MEDWIINRHYFPRSTDLGNCKFSHIIVISPLDWGDQARRMGRGDSRNPSSLIPYAMGFALLYPSYSWLSTGYKKDLSFGLLKSSTGIKTPPSRITWRILGLNNPNPSSCRTYQPSSQRPITSISGGRDNKFLAPFILPNLMVTYRLIILTVVILRANPGYFFDVARQI